MCTRATTVTTPTVGRASAGELRDLAGLVRAELDDERAVLGAETEQRQRQPPLVVEASRGRSVLHRVPSTAATSSFVVVLPFDPVTATTGMLEPRAMPRGQTAERLRRVLHEHERHVRRHLVRQRVHDEAGAPRGPPLRARYAWPSRRWPLIAKNASPTPSARESIDTPGDGHGEVAADERALRRADDVLHRERRHAAG